MTDPRILHIEVSTPQAAMDAFADIWERARRGEAVTPTESIGFESVAELLATLTSARWELIRLVRRHGPLAPEQLPALAGQSSEDIREHLAALSALGILEADASGRVLVPWDEIDLRVPLAA
jgi:predicted transcriptional regulator